MLSSVLNSKQAIEINRGIMRAFVVVRQMISLPPTDKLSELQQEIKELKQYMEEVLIDQNDINEERLARQQETTTMGTISGAYRSVTLIMNQMKLFLRLAS
jgi:uncharacterized membrane protein (DUF106 family)